MQEVSSANPEPVQTVPGPDASNTHYDSNPFTATWNGLRLLVQTNAHNVVGVALCNVLLFVVMGLTMIALLLATAAFVIKRNIEFQSAFSDQTLLDFVHSINDTGIYATWIIGVAVWLSLSALNQGLLLGLTTTAARGESQKFSALLKTSVRAILPLLGYIALILLGIIALFMLVGLLAPVLGPITFVVGFAALLAIAYIGLRLAYAPYSIVSQHLGPVAAMTHSWKLSQGHLIETIGTGAVAWLVVGVPGIIMSALARVTEGAPMVSGTLGLINMTLVSVLAIGVAMAFAVRYAQIQGVMANETTAPSASPFNYAAILLMIVLVPIWSLLSPQVDTQLQEETTLPTDTYFSEPSASPDNSSLYQLN